MKVLCQTLTYTGPYSSFSAGSLIKIGQWYQVLEEHQDYYTILLGTSDSISDFANLSKSYFVTCQEVRQQRLELIL